MFTSLRIAAGALATLAWITCSVSAEDTPAKPARVSRAKGLEFFEAKIRPVLIQHCYECHSSQSGQAKGGLLLDSRDALRQGGESGPAVVPGDLQASQLWDAINYSSYEMPPSGKLPDDVIADFRRWIEIGAPDPRDAVAEPAGDAATSGWKTSGPLWSLEPPVATDPPTVSDTTWPRDPVDHYLLARLEAAGLKPVADAEPLALLRRVYIDLIGLPPPPEEIDAFLADASADAYARLVDRLLASPQFGERWGRHWLDVARFAESNGKDRDVLYPHAWRYRHWVIDAINADMPYDQFLREQLAGDLLAESDPQRADSLRVATGFLAIGPKPLMAGRNNDRFRWEVVDEQIDVTSRAMLGLTVSCARCHDHKFDPIPTTDYYALAGIFRSTDTLFGNGLQNTTAPKDERPLIETLCALGPPVDAAAATAAKQQIEELRQQMNEARRQQSEFQRRNAAIRASGAVPTDEQIRQRSGAENEAKRLAAEIAALEAEARIEPDYCMAVREAKQKEHSPVLIRGDVGQKGDKVPRGFLSAVRNFNGPAIADDASGRRELADWIADPRNPLTARVAVNRIWHHLFGEGLVRSVDNLGHGGERPSHPELLDHLALRFVDEGWSLKQLVRALVLTRSYQLASAFDSHCYATDPDNTLHWRHSPRRFDAETIRDALLAAGGQLDLSVPARSRVAEVGDGEVGRNLNTRPLETPFHHRAVYLPIVRGIVPEVLKLFDFAEPSIVIGRRDVTNIPAQSLFFMNSPLVIEQAESMADRLLAAELPDDAARIDLACRLAFSRPATDDDVQLAREFLALGQQRLTADDNAAATTRAAWAAWCQALLASGEFRFY